MTLIAARYADGVRDPSRWLGVMVLAAIVLATGPAAARQRDQPEPDAGRPALARQIQNRFEVLPTSGGVVLRPRNRARNLRSIEVANGSIAVDGAIVTGAELRTRLDDDTARLVIQLSYLDPEERRALFVPADSLRLAEDPTNRSNKPQRLERRVRMESGADRIRFGGNITVNEGEKVDGNVVAIGGSVSVNGEVAGDVLVFSGSAELGPKAVVGNDVVVVGGTLHRSSEARVGGSVKEISWGMLPNDAHLPPTWFGNWWRRGFGSVFALASTVTRAAVLCLFAALIVLLAGGYVDRVSARASSETLKAGAIGVLAQLLFFPLLLVTIIVLVITIIGLPLLVVIPFVLLGLGLVALIGFTAVARWIGSRVVAALGGTQSGPYLSTFVGILVVLSPTLLTRLIGLANLPMQFSAGLLLTGTFFEYLAWTVGFGAVTLVKFQRTPSGGSLPTLSSPQGGGEAPAAQSSGLV